MANGTSRGGPRFLARWLGYLLAVVGSVAAFAVTQAVPGLCNRAPFALFFIVAGGLTLWAGVGPGVLAIALSVVALQRLSPPLVPLQFVVFVCFSVVVLTFAARQQRLLRTLRDSTRRYQRLVEISNDVVVTYDTDGHIVSVNRLGPQLTGYPLEQVVGRTNADFVVPEHRGRLDDARRSLLAPGGPTSVSFEVDIRAADGRLVTMEVRCGLEVAGDRPAGFQAVARDISERRRLEAQVRQAQKMEAIGRLAGGIAHDFNNLLQAIMGYADSVLCRLDAADPRAEHLRQQLGVCERAADLVRQLLTFGRQQPRKPVELDPNQTVREVESMLRRLIGAEIELVTTFDPDPGRVLVDPNQLMQVLMNLTVNARDAMAQGGTLTIETTNVNTPPGQIRCGAQVEPGP